MLRIGDLRRRISFQKRTSTLDSYGQQSTTWIDVLTNVPAAIEGLGGSERLAAQAINAEATHTVTVRYHDKLADPIATASMRIVYVSGALTRLFNIASVQNIDERNRVIRMTCSEGLNQG